MSVTRVTLQLVVIKSIIFNQILCQCHIIQYPNIYQHTQDGLLKSNIVNNILDFSVQKLQNVTRVPLELPSTVFVFYIKLLHSYFVDCPCKGAHVVDCCFTSSTLYSVYIPVT